MHLFQKGAEEQSQNIDSRVKIKRDSTWKFLGDFQLWSSQEFFWKQIDQSSWKTLTKFCMQAGLNLELLDVESPVWVEEAATSLPRLVMQLKYVSYCIEHIKRQLILDPEPSRQPVQLQTAWRYEVVLPQLKTGCILDTLKWRRCRCW